jgi:glycosyltransferase involved in cell wall biosynthesis
LKEAGIGTGYHGFEIPIPDALRVEGVEQIHARVKNHNWYLPGSPKPKNAKLASIGQAFQGARRPRNQMEVQERLDRIEALLAAQAAALANLLKTIERGPTDAPSAATPKDYGPYFQECLTNAGNKDLVIFSIIDWSFRHQRPQHLAAQFAQKGYRVIYLSVHLQALEGSADARFSVISRPADNVFEVKLRLPGRPPSVYGGFIEPEHLRHACLAVDELITELSIQAPYCFLQFPSWYPVACTIPGAVIVYDCLDHVASFSNVSEEVAKLETELVKEADIVVISSQHLQHHVQQYRQSTIIRNGCDFNYFSTSPALLRPTGSCPTIGYFGAISEWFDVELVANIAARNPDWRFVLIGSTAGCDTTRLSRLSNVKLLGERPYTELTQHLCTFDVCIIPFRLVELIQATNPVKVYEYLAAGKPVVATALPEIQLLPTGLVYVGHNEAEFESALLTAINEQ